MTDKMPKPTDHALVRWLERVHGIDMEWFREEMANEIGPVFPKGDFYVKRGNGKYLISNGRVVTAAENRKKRGFGGLPGIVRADA